MVKLSVIVMTKWNRMKFPKRIHGRRVAQKWGKSSVSKRRHYNRKLSVYKREECVLTVSGVSIQRLRVIFTSWEWQAYKWINCLLVFTYCKRLITAVLIWKVHSASVWMTKATLLLPHVMEMVRCLILCVHVNSNNIMNVLRHSYQLFFV